MRLLAAFLAGGLFGAGLMLSGMTDTNKVRGFLDFLGAWDPTLAFVMGGALIPMAIAWRMTPGRAPLFGGSFPAQVTAVLDRRLVIGSMVFGLGWGLVGLCPGPSLASLSYGGWPGLVFFGAMALGMIGAPRVGRVLNGQQAQA
ncbi:MAG: DUF6691 family protein [Pseudomonadota bacterium]